MHLVDFLTRTKEYQQIQRAATPRQNQLVTGISGSAKTLLLTAVQRHEQRPQLVITDSLFHLQEVATDLENLLPEGTVYQFPVEEVLAAEMATSSPNYRLQRVLALHALESKHSVIVVALTAGIRRPKL